MGVKIHIQSRSVKTGKTTGNTVARGLSLNREIYSKMGNITTSKAITVADANNTSSYSKWLNDMEQLSIAKDSGYTGNIDPDIIAVDNYLGTLAITDEYPFDDRTATPLWLDVNETSDVRSVVSGADNVVFGTANVVHYPINN